MELQYLGNSGFSIRQGGDLIVIDCYNPEQHPEMEARVKNASRVTVLASHYHRDHFSPSVRLWNRWGNVEFVFSSDIPEMPGVKQIAPGEHLTVNGIEVRAYGSTDAGVSFMLEVGGYAIFHAGDLNNWHWEEESTPEEIAQMEGDFKKELNDLAQLAPRLDLAMFPVDPRMGGDFMRGARQFLDRIPTRYFVPMHFWAQPQKVAPFGAYAESKGSRFVLLGEPGEDYELRIKD